MRISAQQKQVGILTTAYQVLIWTIGGSLISVDTSAVYDYLSDFSSRQGLVVFHPLQQRCFFVIHVATPILLPPTGIHTRRIVVQEFSQGKLTMTKFLDLHPSTSEPLGITGLLHDGVIEVFKGFVSHPSRAAESNTDGCQIPSGPGQDGAHDPNSKVFTMVMFDIYRRKFFLDEYSLAIPLRGVHRQDQFLNQVFCWRNRVLLPVCVKFSKLHRELPSK
jgi:hypothetical protein